MGQKFIAGLALRSQAIDRITEHILAVKKSGAGSSLSHITLGKKREYLDDERRRLDTLRALGGGE